MKDLKIATEDPYITVVYEYLKPIFTVYASSPKKFNTVHSSVPKGCVECLVDEDLGSEDNEIISVVNNDIM